MHWFLIALLPPALWAISNHFDKFLLSKYFKDGGIGALMIFSAIIGILILPIIAIIHPEVLHFSINKLLIILNGIIYVLAVLPYLYAMQRDEASVCVPIFQLIPVISFVMGYLILGETLTRNQLIGGAIIVIGSFIISSDIKTKFRIKWDVLLLMTLSSALYALNFILFKYFALESSFWVTSFWEYIGFGVIAIIFFTFVKPYRNQFVSVYKKNKLAMLGLNGVNEVINILAKIAFNAVSLIVPVTLVWVANGLQPLFVIGYGILLTVLSPKLGKEDLGRRALAQKIVSIIIILAGAYLVNL